MKKIPFGEEREANVACSVGQHAPAQRGGGDRVGGGADDRVPAQPAPPAAGCDAGGNQKGNKG